MASEIIKNSKISKQISMRISNELSGQSLVSQITKNALIMSMKLKLMKQGVTVI